MKPNNKKSFFEIYLIKKISEEYENIKDQEDSLAEKADMILGKVGPIEYEISFLRVNKELGQLGLSTFIKVANRKRRSQIQKYCNDVDQENQMTIFVNDYLQTDWVETIKKFKMDPEQEKLYLNINNKLEKEYSRDDIRVLDKVENWNKWERQLYSLIFKVKENNIKPIGKESFRKSSNREIISIVDFVGNSGKSTFWKWILDKYKGEVATIPYGSASQLRSRIVNLGPKKLYIIDLPRTSGRNDNKEDILSVIEEIKSGKVDSTMYGSSESLIFDCPWVIVSSNFEFKYESLSRDRWRVYLMDHKKLELVRKKLSVEKLREMEKKSELALLEVYESC